MYNERNETLRKGENKMKIENSKTSIQDIYAEEWEVSSKDINDQKYYDWMVEQLPLVGTVLEVGCGTGYSTLSLLKHGYSVIAVDNNSYCLSKAKKRTSSYDNVEYIYADITDDEQIKEMLKDKEFDLVAVWNIGPYSGDDLTNILKKLLKSKYSHVEICYDFASTYAHLLSSESIGVANTRAVPINFVDRNSKPDTGDLYPTFCEGTNYSIHTSNVIGGYLPTESGKKLRCENPENSTSSQYLYFISTTLVNDNNMI